MDGSSLLWRVQRGRMRMSRSIGGRGMSASSRRPRDTITVNSRGVFSRSGRRPTRRSVLHHPRGDASRRLNHGGDRQANAALHRIVFTRLGCDPRTQAYDERRTQERKTRHEIIRRLERYGAREVFNLVRTVSTDSPLQGHL